MSCTGPTAMPRPPSGSVGRPGPRPPASPASGGTVPSASPGAGEFAARCHAETPRHEGRTAERLGAWWNSLDADSPSIEGLLVTGRYYEIRVSGILPPEALVDFERLTATVEPVETVLHGPLADQAAPTGP